MDGNESRWRLGVAILVLYALAILSIGIRDDWRLLHEDNGAMHTTFALAHIRLGLARTRAHDLYFEPATGNSFPYSHHPPATALILAAAFALTGSDAPWVARSVVILFHAGSLLLLLALLRRLFPPRTALAGGFLFATLPMSAFFGRMVNYEPLCLLAVLVQLFGLVKLYQSGFRSGLGLLCFGVALGALIDWPSFFFAGAIAAMLTWDAVRGEAEAGRAALLVSAMAGAALAFDLAHLWWAAHGSLEPLREAFQKPARARNLDFFLRRIEAFRRYYTLAGLNASLLAAAALVVPRSRLSRHLFALPDDATVKRLLWVSGGAASVYVLAAPAWAAQNVYWQFYFLPFAVVAMLLGFRFLWDVSGPWRRALRPLAVIFALEFLATSFYTLRVRHTEEGGYAVETTPKFRRQFLAPDSAGPRADAPPSR